MDWSAGTASESRREPVLLRGEPPLQCQPQPLRLEVMVEQGTQDRSGRWAREMQGPELVATVTCDLVVL